MCKNVVDSCYAPEAMTEPFQQCSRVHDPASPGQSPLVQGPRRSSWCSLQFQLLCPSFLLLHHCYLVPADRREGEGSMEQQPGPVPVLVYLWIYSPRLEVLPWIYDSKLGSTLGFSKLTISCLTVCSGCTVPADRVYILFIIFIDSEGEVPLLTGIYPGFFWLLVEAF